MDEQEQPATQEPRTEDLQQEVEQVEQPAEHAPSGPGKFQLWKTKLKDFVVECRRVLRVTKKPDRDEFKTIVKISGLGILLIGLIGFIIHFGKELFLK